LTQAKRGQPGELGRIILIGLDGVPLGLVQDLCRKGLIPETARLVEKGRLMRMESSIPEVSSVAWSSIITGRNPGEHGIFGYTEVPPGTYRTSFPNFTHLKAAPFWLERSDERFVILNVPSTFPAKPLKGVHVSGFVALDLERSVFPGTLIPKLRELDYRIDVDAAKARQSMGLFLQDLEQTLTARIALFRHLWMDAWDVFMLVFTETDRLSHFLWDAYEDEAHPFHSAFLDVFRRIDEIVGEVAARLRDEDLLVLLSDHGFERAASDLNINACLEDNGFLKLRPESRRNLANIDEGTKAFALDPSRIYIHSKAKYPRGSVADQDRDRIREDLAELFGALEFEGGRAIQGIHYKEEIYRGPFVDRAPDIVLIPGYGVNLKAGLQADRVFDKSAFAGKHTQPDAFLLINKALDDKELPDRLSVADAWPLIEKWRALVAEAI